MDVKSNNTFGQMLHNYRKAIGLNQEKFSEQLGVKRQLVSSWERGEKSPTLITVFKFCHVFDLEFLVRKDGIVIFDDTFKKPNDYQKILSPIFYTFTTKAEFAAVAVSFALLMEDEKFDKVEQKIADELKVLKENKII